MRIYIQGELLAAHRAKFNTTDPTLAHDVAMPLLQGGIPAVSFLEAVMI